ncbi:hypothetical protein GCM10022377_06040 [Zhihengliuella alba]|uniref:Uncharacterized protein n=1 Tax=Zhihengliuella alba TaxID=547018 RepID=A0ABP7CY92_9MICC
MAIIRTYRRRDDGSLEFREAWYETYADGGLGQFVINHGSVGHQSTTKDVQDVDEETGESLLAGFELQCREDGFAELAAEEQFWVVAQYPAKSEGGYGQRLRDTAVQVLTPHLAWRGLGTVESAEFAPGKLNIRILTPDVKAAVSAIKTAIRDNNLDFSKLRLAAAPYGEPEKLKQKHPLPPKPFSLD